MVLLWTVLLAVSCVAKALPSPSVEPAGFFWQLTDVHWDREYSQSGDPKKMCHEKRGKSLSDMGKLGTYSCDSPWELVKASITAMAERDNDPDFIVWTGDNSPHVKDPVPDWDYVFSSLRKVTELLRNRFPKSQIIPVLGNHDVYPEDFYPGKTGGIYEAYLKEGGWADLLTHRAKGSFSACGFYAIMPNEAVKVLVLNTNLYNVPDNLTNNIDDPCSQFMWMERELKKSELAGTKVLITAHIPPGYYERYVETPFYNHHHNKKYLDLLNKFGHVIMAHVYGHTHTDSFRLFRGEEKDDVKSVAFIAPSVTPWLHSGGVNPSIRLYSYSYSYITDYWQYYLNLTEVTIRRQQLENDLSLTHQLAVVGKDGSSLLAEKDQMYRAWASRDGSEVKPYLDSIEENDMEIVDRDIYRRNLLKSAVQMKSKGRSRSKRSRSVQSEDDPGWKLLYQATDFYEVPDLKNENMLVVYNKLATNQSFFDRYYAYNTGGHVFEACNYTCKQEHLCAMAHLHNWEMNECLRGKPLMSMGKPILSMSQLKSQPIDKIVNISVNTQSVSRDQPMNEEAFDSGHSAPSSDPEKDLTITVVSAGVVICLVLAIACFILRRKDDSKFSYHTLNKNHRHSYEPIEGEIL